MNKNHDPRTGRFSSSRGGGTSRPKMGKSRHAERQMVVAERREAVARTKQRRTAFVADLVNRRRSPGRAAAQRQRAVRAETAYQAAKASTRRVSRLTRTRRVGRR